jgi:hypothetical protein
VRYFLLEIFFEVLVFPQQLLMVALEVTAEFAKRLDEFVKALRIVDRLRLAVQILQRLLGLVIIDRG